VRVSEVVVEEVDGVVMANAVRRRRRRRRRKVYSKEEATDCLQREQFDSFCSGFQ